jgi:predicted RNA-binding Zn-ribbon protein involved in translation (DUF1610 family)
MAERENYFVMLGLDPSVDDLPTIEAAIQEKKRVWSKQANGIALEKRVAQQRLNQVKAIEATMKDAKARAEERKGAAAAVAALKGGELEKLRKLVEGVKASGLVYTTETFQKLLQSFAGKLTAAEIQQEFNNQGLKPAQPKATRTSRERLDDTMAAKIRADLAVVEKPNLYELLGLSSRSPCRELKARAEETNRKLLRDGLTDPVSSSTKQLAGMCAAVFATEDSRRRYDNTLAFEVMQGFTSLIETMVQGATIVPDQMKHIVEQAVRVGAQPDIAQEWVVEYAEQRKWFVVPEALKPVQTLFCRGCSTLAVPGAKACVDCGEMLVTECPACRAEVATQFAMCPSCGFNISNAHVVKALLRDAQREAARGEFDAAGEALAQGLALWGSWAPLVEERARLTELCQQRDASLGKVEELVRQRKFHEARRAVGALSSGPVGGAVGDLRRRVGETIQRSDELVKQGEAARRGGRTSEAVARFEEALAVCADSQAALDALRACPPEAPREPRAKPLPKGFRVEWEAPAGGALRYRVFRRAGGRPTGPADGALVGETGGGSIDDAAVEGGVSWHYAVFSVRGEVLSTTAAYAGPCLLAANVDRVAVIPGDGSLTLQWTAPPNVQSIEVWRQAGREPARRGDGQAVACTATGLQDSGLQNGTQYAYLIVCVYADRAGGGQAAASEGLRVRSTPVAPPRMVGDLSANEVGGHIELSWTPVPGAQVELRWTDGAAVGAPGTVIARQAADRCGTLIPVTTPGRAVWAPGRQGVFQVTPVTVAGEVATLGRPAVITTVVDVAGLRARVVGRTIVLTWQWPAGVDEVTVRWAYDRFPGVSEGQVAKVSRRVYDTKDAWEIQCPKAIRHYIAVFTKAPGVEVYSSGARLFESMGDVAQVTYQVKVAKTFYGKVEGASIELAGANVDTLRGVMVRAKSPVSPVSPADGVEVLTAAVVNFQQGRASIGIPIQQLDGRSFIKLFFLDPKSNPGVQMLPGPQDKLRLG